MIIVRDVVSYMGVRKLEWIMAGLLLHVGADILANEDGYRNAKILFVLSDYMPNMYWGYVFLAFGFFRLVVLFLNGTHIRQSAELRLVLSCISFVIMCAWVMGLTTAEGVSLAGALSYKYLALGELMNVWQASADLGNRKRAEHHNGTK